MDTELSSTAGGRSSLDAEVARNSESAAAGCPYCGTALERQGASCPQCGASALPVPARDRVSAVLAYMTMLPAIVILILPMFRDRHFVRFHAWQSIFLWGIFLALGVGAVLLSSVASAMVLLLSAILGCLAMVFLSIVLLLKCWQGERFEMPLLGGLAARLA